MTAGKKDKLIDKFNNALDKAKTNEEVRALYKTAGTKDFKNKARKRRAKNKVARASRKANRTIKHK